MKLKILTVVCFVILLVVGFCFAGVVNSGPGVQDEEPFTVTVIRGISSFMEGFGSPGDAPELPVKSSGSTVHEVGAFQPDDPNYYGAELHAVTRPVPAEAAEKKLIMSQNIDFVWTARSFEADIKDGPMVITYYINEHDDTTAACFMEVTVTDCTTGEVLLEDGYRRQYSADLKKERALYYEGPVRIDLYGNLVNADIFIYADR